MRAIIAGGRDYKWDDRDLALLDVMHKQRKIDVVLCGLARGADMLGEYWAKDKGVPIMYFPADWTAYGKKAGILRNIEMAENADMLIAFPGGRGTNHMITEASRKGLLVFKVGPWDVKEYDDVYLR